MSVDLIASLASVVIALAAVLTTTILLSRQIRQMEHERNALAVLEAIERITDPAVVSIFKRLRGINERYPDDDDIRKHFHGSQDADDLAVIGQFVGTVATLARRRIIDASLLADAVGVSLRRDWETIREFIERRRRIEDNPYLAENQEWLAMYCAWWKDTPRPAKDPNYDPEQFAGVKFHV